VLLERLPRSEWSATAQHETALAERISQLRKMYGVYTFHGQKPVDKMGTLLERYDPPAFAIRSQPCGRVESAVAQSVGQ